MTDETILKLGDIYLQVGSSRGLTQSLALVSNGDLRRTVNGSLIDLTREQQRKFNSTISGSDIAAPAIQDLWRGQELEVECIQPFRQTVFPVSLTATLIRDPVSGSVFGRIADGTKIFPTSVIALVATFAQNVSMVEYRPILTMLVSDISIDNDEYAAQEGWSIDLEEV